jgi:DNA modification methylase
MWSVDKLVPYDKNPRTIPDSAVAKVCGSLKEFGFQKPIVVDETGMIVAGHVLWKAAKQAGFTRVPVAISSLTAVQAKAYRLADNRTASETDWIDDLLKNELAELKELDFDLDLTGFDSAELARMFDQTEGLTDPDDTPEPPVNPVTELGDVWVLGRHRIVCGDATNPEDWNKLAIGDGFVLFTSPPYNAGDASGLRDRYEPGIPKTKKFYDNYTDDLSGDQYTRLLSDTVAAAFGHVDAVAINVQPLAGSKRPLLKWLDQWSTHLVDMITWDKGRAAPHIQPGIMASRYEWIVILSRAENASRVVPHSSWQGKHANVYQAPPQTKNEFAKVHGATFPVHLPEFMIGDLMNRARGVVDCFLGTGTTIIAAERLGRDGRGIELSPAYVDVAVKRWQDFTGQKATLDSDGRTFEEIDAARYAKVGAPDNSAKSYDAAIAKLREQHESNAA